MTKHRSFTALALAFALLCTLISPARAALTPRLTYQQSGNTAQLTLTNLGQESVYGVQLELTLEGEYPSAAFVPASSTAYAPPCHRSVTGDATLVTVYLTAQSPLNSGGTLSMGALTLPASFTMPEAAAVTLLNRDLKPLTDRQAITVSRQTTSSGGGSGGSGGGGGGGAAAVYTVTVAASEGGKVTANFDQAAAGDEITLTPKADEGYELDTVTVTNAKGSKVKVEERSNGGFAFQMPASAVTVTATFRFTGILRTGLPFADVAEDAWYLDGVRYVYDKGMMNGTSESTFAPEAPTSRAMLVTILYRLTGAPPAPTPTFPDVPTAQYYTYAVGWAAQQSIVTGYETGLFQPDSTLTREQLAAILYRYSRAMGYNTTLRGDLSTFSDRDKISPYATDPMSWAVASGLLSGMGDGTVAPGGHATRAQVATILTRFCKNVAKV